MEEFYNKHYKKLFFIPIIILIIALISILSFYSTHGDIFHKDVSLKGGITLSVYTPDEIDVDELSSKLLDKFPKADLFVRKLSEFGTEKQIGVTIEASEIKADELQDEIESLLNLKLTQKNHSMEEMGSTLGENFYKQMFIAIFLAFIFMGIVVLIAFRTIIPSIAVISAAFIDIVVTIAIINLIGMRMSTAGIAALLLLIGYSIDTDILLTTKVIKRKEGRVFDRLVGGTKTGLTMTFTTITALFIAYIVTSSFVLEQMFSIILIGLFIDLITTYCMNAALLKWYADKKCQ